MTTRALLVILVAGGLGACAVDTTAGVGDDDDTADGDADTDSDADSDADADADTDVDADHDEANDAACSDGDDNDHDLLTDCSDPSCAAQQVCCEQASTGLLTDAFDGPLDLGRWKPFGTPSAVIGDSLIRPAGDDSYESGVVSVDPLALGGALELRATLRVPVGCADCRELIGVSFTASNAYAEESTVDPVAGVVLDLAAGELLAVVQGRVEARLPLGAEDQHTISILVHPDRHVTVRDVDSGQIEYGGTATIDPALDLLYVAIHGRGGQDAGVDALSVSATVCSLPSAGRRSAVPVVAPAVGGPVAVRSPGVVVSSDGEIEMLYTAVTNDQSAVRRALSSDGRVWTAEPPDTEVIGNADLPFGYRDADDPSLVILDGGSYLAAVSAAQVDDAQARAISLLTSADGLSWTLAEGSQPLAMPEYCSSMSDPALALRGDGNVALYFTCSDANGLTSIGHASSVDATNWDFRAAPEIVGDGSSLESTGVAAPSVLIDPSDGNAYLWYEARDGFVRTIRTAASVDGVRWNRWDGVVLQPGAPGSWDSLAVGAPSAAILDGRELLLYYTGQGAAGQAIGLVDRQLPSL
jgi:hypothetical protein